VKVDGLSNGCLLRGRPNTYIRKDSMRDLQIHRDLSWAKGEFTPGADELLMYLGDYGRPGHDRRRTVLWRGRVLRVNAASWRYLELASGEESSEGMRRDGVGDAQKA
jgi:hypothetical protein